MIITLPPADYCDELHIDLQPSDFVQIKKVDGKWQIATSLADVKTCAKRPSKK